MTWTDILEIVRWLARWDASGAVITWHAESRLYYSGEWCVMDNLKLLHGAALINLDADIADGFSAVYQAGLVLEATS